MEFFSRRTVSRGFTLIELLVVIAIIGLLSSIVLASLSTARNKGYDAQRQTNLTQIQTALSLYYNDFGKYPAANGSYTSSGTGAYASQCQVGGNVPQNSVITGLTPTYISTEPTDSQMVPSTNSCCYEYYVSSTGADYKYLFFGCSTSGSNNPSGPLKDPARTNAWAVYTSGAAAN